MDESNQVQIAREAPSCIDCGARPATTCEHCRAVVCSTHVQSGRTAALLLFGPFFQRADETCCRLCYRRRLWLAWRGLVSVIGAAVTVVAVIQAEVIAIAFIVIAVAGWWYVSGLALAKLPPRALPEKTS